MILHSSGRSGSPPRQPIPRPRQLGFRCIVIIDEGDCRQGVGIGVSSRQLSSLRLVLAVTSGAVFFSIQGIARPIRAITAVMQQLAGGDMVAGVPYAGRCDEIGDMADAVEVFRQNAQTKICLELENRDQRNWADAVRHGAGARIKFQQFPPM
jgi:HAMP domain-containing protein